MQDYIPPTAPPLEDPNVTILLANLDEELTQKNTEVNQLLATIEYKAKRGQNFNNEMVRMDQVEEYVQQLKAARLSSVKMVSLLNFYYSEIVDLRTKVAALGTGGGESEPGA